MAPTMYQQYVLGIHSSWDYAPEVPKKVETKKEKIARVAKEKMYASWRVINQKQVNLNELIRVPKPKFNLLARNRC